MRRIAEDAEELRERVTERLTAAGVLESGDSGLLSLSRLVFRTRRYVTVAGQAEQEIHLRIMNILFSEALPDPRDAVIISLVHSCGVFQRMLSQDEYSEVREKIELYARLDRFGRAMAHAIENLTVADSQALRRTLIREGGNWPESAWAAGVGRYSTDKQKGHGTLSVRTVYEARPGV